MQVPINAKGIIWWYMFAPGGHNCNQKSERSWIRNFFRYQIFSNTKFDTKYFQYQIRYFFQYQIFSNTESNIYFDTKMFKWWLIFTKKKDGASKSGKIFNLQMAGSAIWWPNLQPIHGHDHDHHLHCHHHPHPHLVSKRNKVALRSHSGHWLVFHF